MLRRPMTRPRRPLVGAAQVDGSASAAGLAQDTSRTREPGREERLSALERTQSEPLPQTAPMAQVSPVAAAGGPTDDIASKLLELTGFMDQGILTPAEFETAKQKILDE